MRLITFRPLQDDSKGLDTLLVGVELPDSKQVVNLNAALSQPTLTMRIFLEQGPPALQLAGQAVAAGSHRLSRDTIRIMAPIYDPEKIICIGKDTCAQHTSQLREDSEL